MGCFHSPFPKGSTRNGRNLFLKAYRDTIPHFRSFFQQPKNEHLQPLSEDAHGALSLNLYVIRFGFLNDHFGYYDFQGIEYH